MLCRKKRFGCGDVVTVKRCHESFRLPHRLPEGAAVMVESIRDGYVDVATEQGRFTLPLGCVESGWEFVADSRSFTTHSTPVLGAV